jgi:hypothetical protein
VGDEHDRNPFDGPPKRGGTGAEEDDDLVNGQQRNRGDQAAGYRCLRAHHGVLDRVADEEQDHEIEWRHLTDLALPGQSYADQHRDVYDDRASGDIAEHRRIPHPRSIERLRLSHKRAC